MLIINYFTHWNLIIIFVPSLEFVHCVYVYVMNVMLINELYHRVMLLINFTLTLT